MVNALSKHLTPGKKPLKEPRCVFKVGPELDHEKDKAFLVCALSTFLKVPAFVPWIPKSLLTENDSSNRDSIN